ncbi:uncharacterized protein METZ01_LOCUS452979, partial [marine metagenome]
GSVSVVPTSLEFIDIAGLVRGASAGEGLGNQFLGHIREVDAIAHVIRCFGSSEVSRDNGKIDPVSDAQIVETELILSDLDSLERRRDALTKKGQRGDKDAGVLLDVMNMVEGTLEKGLPVRSMSLDARTSKLLENFGLLSAKPVMYVCNVEEAAVARGNSYSRALGSYAESQNAACLVASARIEAEIATIGEEGERGDFLESLGLMESGLARVVRAGYSLLGLITFFTAGPKETRAWTVRRGSSALEAAAKIHT